MRKLRLAEPTLGNQEEKKEQDKRDELDKQDR
jgi:hypothetical protein